MPVPTSPVWFVEVGLDNRDSNRGNGRTQNARLDAQVGPTRSDLVGPGVARQVAPVGVPPTSPLAGRRFHGATPVQSDILRAPSAGSCSLRWYGHGQEEQLGLGAFKLKPDGIAVITVENSQSAPSSRRIVLAIEADCATESKRVLDAKHRRYAAAIGAGVIDEIWWVTTGDDRRLETIRRSARGAGLETIRAMKLGHVFARPVTAPPPMIGREIQRAPATIPTREEAAARMIPQTGSRMPSVMTTLQTTTQKDRVSGGANRAQAQALSETRADDDRPPGGLVDRLLGRPPGR